MSGVRLRFALAASVLDQGTASLIGLTLTVVTGRTLGATGLGNVALALALYLVVMGFHRALVLEPLAVQPPAHRGEARSALTGALVVGAAGTVAMYGLAEVLGGGARAALAAFAPWIPAGLLVETARVAGFREGRTTIGVSAHATWLAVMSTLLWGFGLSTTAHAATAWGAGAAAGAVVAVLRLRQIPAHPADALGWWRTAWPLGRWLALQTVAFTGGIQGAQLAVGIVAGPAALGTLKAVQTLCAPLTLLVPAVNTPALPVVARTLRASGAAARSLSARLTALLCSICGLYLAVVIAARGTLVDLAFGGGLDVPARVVWPIAVEQLVVAASLGAFLMLKAAGDGRSVFVATAAGGATALVCASFLAALEGAAGGGWGLAAGGAVATAVALVRASSVGKDAPGPAVRVRLGHVS